MQTFKKFFSLAVLIFCIVIIAQLPLAQTEVNAETKEGRDNTGTSWDNQGYLYYNPDIPEEIQKNKPAKIVIPSIQTEPIRHKTIPSIPKKYEPRPDAYSQETVKTPTQATPEPASDEEETSLLKQKLDDALNQLSLANQKLKEMQEKYAASKTTQTYMVKKGDCLWSIAKKKEIYGDPYKWLLLYHANRDQIYDPRLIFTNMVLIVPRLEEYEKKK